MGLCISRDPAVYSVILVARATSEFSLIPLLRFSGLLIVKLRLAQLRLERRGFAALVSNLF